MEIVSFAESWTDSLLEHCASGDEVAWSRLYLRYERPARRFLYRLGVPVEQVDDACQEVFLQVYRYLPNFRGDCSFKTWLYRLCVTQARRTRGKARVLSLLRTMMVAQKPQEAVYGEVSSRKAEELMQGALGCLTELERATFVLFELEGVSGTEIAKISECPEATVWRRLHDARKKFRAHVREHGAVA